MNNVEQLVREHWELVPTVIRNYFYYKGGQWDDLVSVGLIGLWKAAQQYDPARSKFVTYATLKIREHVRDYLRRHWRHRNRIGMHLDDRYGEDDNHYWWMEDLVQAAYLEEVENRVYVEQLLKLLTEQDRDIIERYFGLKGEPELLRDIGKTYGYSYNGLHKRVKTLLKKLREAA